MTEKFTPLMKGYYCRLSGAVTIEPAENCYGERHNHVEIKRIEI